MNGVRILRELFNALKPGGLLIFNDRWWDHEKRTSMTMDMLFHPIRMHKAVFDAFLTGFTTVYKRTNEESSAFQMGGHAYQGIYLIARKKSAAELCTS